MLRIDRVVTVGRSIRTICMDLDHVRGTKKFTIGTHTARRYSMAELIEEIVKCDVVCAVCHRFRTFWAELEH